MGDNFQSIKVSVVFRNTEATEAIKNYVVSKVQNVVGKFASGDSIEVHVVLEVEKINHICEAEFNFKGAHVVAKEHSSDMYASIDAVAHTLSGILRKQKEKLTKHH